MWLEAPASPVNSLLSRPQSIYSPQRLTLGRLTQRSGPCPQPPGSRVGGFCFLFQAEETQTNPYEFCRIAELSILELSAVWGYTSLGLFYGSLR